MCNLVVKLLLLMLLTCCVTSGLPQLFETRNFKVGIEYVHSLPMSGGSDLYRHRNNYDPFFVTVTATAKKDYVISYMEVTATTDLSGEIEFCLLQGKTGSKTMVFQLVSNHSDFLSYSYLAYGIREEEYKKVTNILTLPMNNGGRKTELYLSIFLCTFICLFVLI